MAVRFDGTSGKYYDTTTGLPAAGTYTYALFFMPIGAVNRAHAVSQGSTYQSLAADVAGTSWGVWDASGYSSAGFGATTLTANTWYALAVVVSGSSNVTYYHGPIGGTITNSNATNYAGARPTQLRIGDYTGGGFPLNGRVAGFKYWDAALNATEIAAELAQFAPVRTTNLLRYHPLHFAETKDRSSNGNNLTVTGTPVAAPDPLVPEVSGGPYLVDSDHKWNSGANGNATSTGWTSKSFTGLQAGDVVIAKVNTWDASATPGSVSDSLGALSFATLVDYHPASFRAYQRIYGATVSGTPGSLTITSAAPSASCNNDLTVEVWRGGHLAATPVTATANVGAGPAQTSLTTSAANSVITFSVGDESSIDPATRAYVGTATETGLTDGHAGTNGNFYSAAQFAGAAGATTFGLTAPTTGTAWNISGVEILAGAGSGGGSTTGALAGSLGALATGGQIVGVDFTSGALAGSLGALATGGQIVGVDFTSGALAGSLGALTTGGQIVGVDFTSGALGGALPALSGIGGSWATAAPTLTGLLGGGLPALAAPVGSWYDVVPPSVLYAGPGVDLTAATFAGAGVDLTTTLFSGPAMIG